MPKCRRLAPRLGADIRDEEVVREWLARAQDDLEASRLLAHGNLLALSAFHAQQAREKALKAVAIGRGLGLDRTHDLSRLAKMLKAPHAIIEGAAFLNAFYVGGRYPDVGAEVSSGDVERATKAAAEVLEWSQSQRS